jgi:hypothetical protein
MDPRDRRLLPFAIAPFFGLLAMIITGAVVAWPGGAFDISGMWTILVVGVLMTLGSGLALLLLFRPR